MPPDRASTRRDIAFAEVVETETEAWPLGGRPDDALIAEHSIDSGLRQRVELQRHVLLGGRHSAYPMTAIAFEDKTRLYLQERRCPSRTRTDTVRILSPHFSAFGESSCVGGATNPQVRWLAVTVTKSCR